MRQERGSNRTTRSSALWGKPSKGETRSSALWGKGGRGLMTVVSVAVALAVPLAATAGSGSSGGSVKAYLSPGLLEAAKAKPKAKFDVIVQATEGKETSDVVSEVKDAIRTAPGSAFGLRRRYVTIEGAAAQLTGRQLLVLARRSDIGAITSDGPVVLSGYSNSQRWPFVSSVQKFWATGSTAKLPTIAIVDSGIEKGRLDFDKGARVVDERVLTGLSPNSPGDGRGHGTFVAGIAAGSGSGYAGAAPQAPIVSIDVMDDNGMAMTRDVIAAADWIYENKESRNIRVANFSLHSGAWASVFFDPLDKAVETLWLNGVVVVAAAGNYGVAGAPSGVPFAPGNDPFVITVGADDSERSVSTTDDVAAPWSTYGYTLDGFAKPELGAPGRYIVGPVPPASTLVAERPANVVASGYMQLSGTSFAAPVVAGAAAQILGVHPNWTPDQVKGALMLTAKPAPEAAPLSLGVGVVDAAKAAAVVDPPNPNLALYAFVKTGADGSRYFDAYDWAQVASSDASWASASWSSASWASASWSSASWASASWANASWASASWANDSTAALAYEDASWASTSYADNAEGDASAEAGELAAEPEVYAAETEMGMDLNDDGVVGDPLAPTVLP